MKNLDFYQKFFDIFSKYAWAVPLKDEKGVSIVNAFQKILNDSAELIWVDKGSELYNSLFKKWLKIMVLKCVRYITKENLLLLKDLLKL